ncbi:cytochrome c oxidase assembly protein [Pseudonocardia acaciae]|uniref:cytochrome c oxidase assembly protein n=1 Tax=Pseudonocardia acaciae TaxID=551276 RepID=UPI0006844AEE|nr:cytochrome c oxidase assembly protein [Pseudonocardia acaciae]
MRAFFVLGLAGLSLAAALTGGLVAALAPSLAGRFGLPEPGPVVDVGLPFARVLALGTGAACIGCLLLAAALAPGEADRDAPVSASGYAGLRAARWWSLAHALASAAVAVLTVLENTGIGPGQALVNGPALLVGLDQIQPAAGWLLDAAVAMLVAGLAGWVLSWRGAVGLLLFALAGPLCVALTAATNAQRSHDIAGDALALRLLAALLWLGGALVVLTGRARRAVARRHAALARWWLPIVAATGVVSTAYAMGPVGPAELVGSGYGRLVLASAAVLAALTGVVILRARAGARRLAALEVALLVIAACLDTAMTRIIPPAELGYQPSRHIYMLGHDLPATMTALDLTVRWRLDLVLGSLAGLAAVVYLLGVRRLRRLAGERWPARYTAAWLAGCAVLLVATSSGLGNYGPAVFSVHMVQHMLLASLAPALLVLGHGLTLARRASADPTGRRLAALLDTPAARLAANPVAALAATAIMLFGLYPTGLFDAIVREHWAHLAMNSSVFLAGLALFWSVLGRGGSVPGRRALPPIGQIVMVFAVMGLHAAFSAWLLGRAVPVAGVYYGSLDLPFVPDPLADQRLGAVLAWALGELPVLVAVVALVTRWARDDRTAVRDVNGVTLTSDRELTGSPR